MQRRPASVLIPFTLLVVSGVGVAGCGDNFSDEQFGALELGALYPTAGGLAGEPPSEIPADPGYLDEQPAEYYDLGEVPTVVDPFTGVPLSARVAPMYFFYTSQDQPLFSRPVRELRDGTDWIKGGNNVLDPNPLDFCKGVTGDQTACKAKNEAEKKKSYPLRRREPLIDPMRGSNDYQRPIVDLQPQDNDPPRRQYTGLWEVVEVVAPKGYVPDAIKSYSTLQKAIDSGKFKVRHTGKVINCPIVDERTHVLRGMTARRIFRPRIEIWYRRLLAFCYLANGWETLGNEAGQGWFAGPESDADRLQTFDVARIGVGAGRNAGSELIVPVGRAYVPAVVSDDQSFVNDPNVTRIAYNTITNSRPRHTPADPPGYSPLRWMFDVIAPPDYVSGGWQSVSDLNPAKYVPRRTAGGDPIVRNVALRGTAVPCSFEPSFKKTVKQCGKEVPNPRDPANTIFDPRGDPKCNAEKDPFNPDDKGLECNKDTCFCDAPLVGYGQACGPGVGRCNPDRAVGFKDGKEEVFSEFGYECFPPWGGFCQLACSGGVPNELSAMNMGKKIQEAVDSRCKGVPGYICYAPLGTCIKFCDQNISNPSQCKAEVSFQNMSIDIDEGMTCQDFGAHACAWPDTYSPKEWPLP